MAAKSILGRNQYDTYTMDDFFDTYDALASGALNKTQVGYQVSSTGGNFFKNPVEIGSNIYADASNLGSILGKTAELEAYKTRKKQQTDLAAQGATRTSSILGGTVI